MMMDFIIADKEKRDIGFVRPDTYLDLDIGKTNDFVLEVNLSDYDCEMYRQGNVLYCLNTEYGGFLDDPEVSTADGTISFTCDTFRGMLSKKYIIPPSGHAYKTISGELNACLKSIIGSSFGGVFVVSSVNTGVRVTDYKFDRYCSFLDGINKMLESAKHRLGVKCIQSGNSFLVELSAVPIKDYSASVETSQDSNINFRIKRYTNKYNYMICLGKGELLERTVIFLHLKEDGSVETISGIPNGSDVKVYLYDYPNVESEEDLLKSGINKFGEINNTDTQKLTVADDLELEINDIIGGRDYVTGISISQKITRKIVKMKNGTVNISYTVGDGD